MRRDEALGRELLAGERVVWSGGPARGFAGLGFEDGFQLLIFVIAGAIFLTIVFHVWGTQNVWDAQRLLPYLPVALVVAAVLGALVVVVSWGVSTIYAVTDRRVLIIRAGLWSDVRALPLDRLPEVTLRASSGGRGTIVFGQHSLAPRDEGGRSEPKFIGIADARRVFRLIQEGATPRPAR